MKRSDLVAALNKYSNKSDQTDTEWNLFLDVAGERIKRRFPDANITLLRDPTDQNLVTIHHPQLYIYAALRELHLSLQDEEKANDYHDLWNSEADKMDITYQGEDWTSPSPVVCSEQEQAYATD